jgi:DNA-binding response OmpR family regulator
MNTQSRVVMTVNAEVRDLLPAFMENRRKDLEAIRVALDAGDYGAISLIAHNMQGFGRGYGFELIAQIGEKLRKAAEGEHSQEVRRLHRKLAEFLAGVQSSEKTADTPAAAESGAEETPRVLIVADGEASCQLLAQSLTGEGLSIVQIASAEELPETLEGFTEPVVVVLDSALRGTDGYQICRRVKSDPATLSTPIILLTGVDSYEARMRGIESSADAFLTKPADRRELVARIRALSRLTRARKLAEGQRAQKEIAKQQRLARTFERYLTPKVAQLILSRRCDGEAPTLKNIRREAEVLFADLRGFTRVSAGLDVEQVACMLDEYFCALMAAAGRYDGTVFNMTGDGLLIGFNVPFEQQDASRRALMAACDMMRSFGGVAQSWEARLGVQVGLGIGINRGEVIVGNIGSPEYMSYTIIGDTVNVAARLTDAARAGEIVVGEAMLPIARRHLPGLREETTEPLVVKGKTRPLKVCRIEVGRLTDAEGRLETTMPRVLVIDDCADMRALVSRFILLEWPLATVEGWDPIEQGQPGSEFDWNRFDVVFLDYMLGEEDGLEWLRHFRRNPKCPAVVFFSGVNDESLAVNALKCGAMHYLAKRDLSRTKVVEAVGAAMSEGSRTSLLPATADTAPGPTQPLPRDADATPVPETQAAGAPSETDDIRVPGYRSLGMLGRGGMSATYLAIRERDSTKLVLKVLDKELARERDMQRRFLRETLIVCRISSPYVVRILDQGIAPCGLYLAMEYLTGGDLKSRIWDGIAPMKALEITYKLSHALDAIHAAGVVHRDIKPQNIMFRANGSPALIDFGISKELDENRPLTRPGMICGTPHYISPEQWLGQPADTRSDIYSLGAVLYEMLTRKKLFMQSSISAVADQHINTPPPSLPGDLAIYQDLLAKMVAKDPAARFQSARELSIAILDCFPRRTEDSARTVVPAMASA